MSETVAEFDANNHILRRWVAELLACGDLTTDAIATAFRRARASAKRAAVKAESVEATQPAAAAGADRSLRWTESIFAEGDAAYGALFVGMFLPADVAAALAIDGYETPDKLHVTLCLHDAALDELTLAKIVAAIAGNVEWREPIAATIAGMGRFYGADGGPDAIYASPDAPKLAEFQQDVYRAIMGATFDPAGGQPVADPEHGFIPHITLAYVDPGAPSPVDAVPPLAFRLGEVVVAYGERMVAIPLRGGGAGYATYGEVVVGEANGAARLFADVSLAEVPSVVPILPKPGSYTHPTYGALDITPEMIDRIVSNFEARVYQQDVPIDAEHVAKTAGAMGWIRSLVKRPDGGLDGVPEFTDLGAEMIRRDRFKYASAELSTYENPLTLERTPDVLTGLALCTRPFFKEAFLPRLAASERAASDDPPGDRQEVLGMSEQDSNPAAVALTEADVKALTERVALAEAENKRLAEQVEAQRAEADRKAFTDEAMGRSDANGQPWAFAGELVADYVAIQRALPEAERKAYRESMRRLSVALTEAQKQARLFGETGTDAHGATETSAYAEAMTRAKAAHAADPSKTVEQHFSQIAQDPETNRRLYAEMKGR